MRKPLLIIGAIVGAIVLGVAAVVLYAVANLNSIIADNRDALLASVSKSLGRKVEVAGISVHLGWGVSADLAGISIADDSDFSSQPFAQVSDLNAEVDLIPLLARQLEISRVVLRNPEIRILRDANGQLNVMTIGTKAGQEREKRHEKKLPEGGEVQQSPLTEAPKSSRGANVIHGLEVHNFAIEEGKIVYEASGQPAVAISHVDLEVSGFSFISAFDLKLKMAAFGGDAQNFELSGQIGPVIAGGQIDLTAIPVDLRLQTGPFTLDQLRELTKAMPAKLEVSDTIGADTTIKGPLGALSIHVASDLSSNQINFGDSFRKPAGALLKVDIDANRTSDEMGLSIGEVKLGDLDLKATNIKFAAGQFRARIDTNRFDIASLAALAPAASKLGISGASELHADVVLAGGKPSADGVVTLAGVTIPRPGQGAAISDLNGDIKLAGTAADIGPLAFKLGAGQATLKAHSDPIYPPNATYDFTADSLRTADFASRRPPNEHLDQIRARGTFSLTDGGFADDNKLTSPSGNINNIPYNNLSVTTSLAGKQLRVPEIKIGAFSGSIVGNADARLDAGGPFNTAVTMTNLNLQQALESQKAKAAGTVRGLLSGRLQLSGNNNGNFDAIKPTLAGNGQVQVTQGKLVGINIAARLFEKTQNLPVIGSLVPQPIANNHPELFQSPDTDFEQMGLTFVIQGQRITSDDIVMKTVDYALMGDGWFDMDKNVDLTARVLLTQQLSQEIIEQKKNVVFLTNKGGQVVIPLRIVGQFPKPAIVPDVAELAQRAGQRALEEKGQKALKGLGKFLGGGDSGSGSLNLKGLFGH
ncbi:MAG: AsmA family protein [Candidatus Binataceae bacterium]